MWSNPASRSLRCRLPSRLALLAVLAALQWAWFLRAVPELHGNDFGIFYRSVASATPYLPHHDNPAMESGALLTNLNPPHFHLVILPFTRLPFVVACIIWWTMNGLLLWAALTRWLRDQGQRWSASNVVWALLWAPIVTMGFTGQVTVVVGVPLWFGLRALMSGYHRSGGFLFGLALSVKPILWPLGLWLVVRRAWGAVMGMFAGGAIAVIAGMAVYGPDAYRDWVVALGGIAWGAQVMNASLAAIAIRLPVSSPETLWLSVGAFLAVFTVWRTQDRTLREAWPAIVAASLLASPLGWVYYGAWLLPGTTLADWTRWPGLAWCAPLIAVAGLGNLGAPLWATAGSCYGLALMAIWWCAVATDSNQSIPAARAA
jgi:hypothetical protein